jgi:hypothetical protein
MTNKMRIEQSQRFLSEVIKQVGAGNMIPAGMQRQYEWREKDVLDFCESLIERFPIGSILTWRPSKDIDITQVAKGRLGPIAPEQIKERAYLILDGQNRLATFAWMLGGELPDDLSPAEIETWKGRTLVIDAEAGGFIFVPDQEANSGLRIPSSVCASHLQSRLMGEHYKRWSNEGFSEKECDAFLYVIDYITNNIREARMIETVLDGATPQEAKSAFLKICKTGVPMAEADFDRALQWLSDADQPGIPSL